MSLEINEDTSCVEQERLQTVIIIQTSVWSSLNLHCHKNIILTPKINFETRKSSCVKTQEAYRPQRVLSMAGPA